MVNKLLQNMNEQQMQAVMHTEGPLLVLAGAGSGKTRVLTHRIAYLLDEKQVEPYHILAITFTNKAAREMKERTLQLLGDLAENVWISTFHSMCVRILRRDSDRIGINRNFTILDPSDQRTVIKDILKELNIDSKQYEPKMFISVISNYKNELIAADDVKVTPYPSSQIIKSVYQAYEKKLLRNHAMDFDDLIMTTIRLFERVPEVLQYYQYKFQYIHVDEYQDTNKAQYQLVNMLAKQFNNICVVGDIDQSIYGWRGADIQNILNFERDYPKGQTILLERNYRSTKNILAAANDIIRHNKDRKPKKLWTDNPEGEKIQVYTAYDEKDEANYIAGKIKTAIDQGFKLNEMAILYRTNAQSRVLEESLMRNNIAYRMIGGTKFFSRKEIRDIVSYLNLVINPSDDISLTRIINVPKRGVGPGSLQKMMDYASQHQLTLFETLLQIEHVGVSKKVASAMQDLAQLLQDFNRMQEYVSVTDLLSEVIDKTGYREMLVAERTIESQSRLENIEELMSVTQEFDRTAEAPTLMEFLTELSLSTDLDETPQTDDAVILMTMHAAKGLEFKIVFIVGMEETIFPTIRALQEEDDKGLEEERRLAYVGVTRAEQILHLTHAKSRLLYGRTHNNRISRFIKEISPLLREGNNRMPDLKTPFMYDKANYQAPSATKKERTATETSQWQINDIAEHRKWGRGKVIKVAGDSVTLVFESQGIKVLDIKYAPIKKV